MWQGRWCDDARPGQARSNADPLRGPGWLCLAGPAARSRRAPVIGRGAAACGACRAAGHHRSHSVLRITALLGPLAEWGGESCLVAPVDGPPVAPGDLVGRASGRPRALSLARRKAG
jgi:hypothetical protein